MTTVTEIAHNLRNFSEKKSDGLKSMNDMRPSCDMILEALLQSIHPNQLHSAVMSSAEFSDTTRKELIERIHKFMSMLTETVHKKRDRTVLYIPSIPGCDYEITDNETLRGLESLLINWTRQMRELIQVTESKKDGHQGPLNEIARWKNRSVDLNGLEEQLERKELGIILSQLELAKSPYLAPFHKLRDTIRHETTSAEENSKFLASLEGPCEKLAEASPSEMPQTFPPIIQSIQQIWYWCPSYSSPERIGGLLSLVAESIIDRCRHRIDADAIFSGITPVHIALLASPLVGDVDDVLVVLDESLKAGKEWKRVYLETVECMEERRWEFDVARLFSNLDAFRQRCVDLKDLCQAQRQFAPPDRIPTFPGLHGKHIHSRIVDIHGRFRSLVDGLKVVGYDVLTVGQSRWMDDFSVFRTGMKDLEMMFCNVMTAALDEVVALSDQLTVLEIYGSMTKTEIIKRDHQKKLAQFYQAFLKEIQVVKKEFEQLRGHPMSHPTLSRYAGTARGAMILMRRLEETWTAMSETHRQLNLELKGTEVKEAYSSLYHSLEQFIDSRHQQWCHSIDESISNGLGRNLMKRDPDLGKGCLVMNFDPAVMNMLQEVHWWEGLRLDGPYIAMEINAQRHRYRFFRESSLAIIRDYNAVMKGLDQNNQRLFRDRLKVLDRKVLPGVSKLVWSSDHRTLDYYFKEATKQCKESLKLVRSFQEIHAEMTTLCETIAEAPFVSLETKRFYSIAEFEEIQKTHVTSIAEMLQKTTDRFKTCLARIYTFFEDDSEDVQREWTLYTSRIDSMLGEALKSAVRRSLHRISRSLNGEKRKEIPPLFGVTVVLDKTHRVELYPTIQTVFDTIHRVCRELVAAVKCVPRLIQTPANFQDTATSFYERISHDEEATLKFIVQITNGVTSIVEKIQQFLSYWERKYKALWDQDKDAYIRRYEKAGKSLSAFTTDITKHQDYQEEVAAEDAVSNVKFLRIECSPLKQTLMHHSIEWVQRLTALLHRSARNELQSIEHYLSSSTTIFDDMPQRLETLAEAVRHHRRLREEQRQMEARFEPLKAKYTTLERFEVVISDEEQSVLDTLEERWSQFLSRFGEAQEMLDDAKDVLRETIDTTMSHFQTEIQSHYQQFINTAPTSDEATTPAEALSFLAAAEKNVDEKRNKAAELQKGMDLFGIEMPRCRELNAQEQAIAKLRQCWDLRSEWDRLYTSWKDTQFFDIDVEAIAEKARKIHQAVDGVSHENDWQVVSHTNASMEIFNAVMPRIKELHHPALRPVHWKALQKEIGSTFVPQSPNFTMESALHLRLDLFSEFISQLLATATNELKSEHSTPTD